MKIGVISDTHGKLDPAVLRLFRGVERIIHAGDIGRLEVVAGLEALAPVIAVEGNNDHFGRFPLERVETLAGRRILVRHIVGERHRLSPRDRARLAQLRPDVVVFGHSHRPYRGRLGSTLLFNPGSAGPRRFTLPRTVGLLWLEPDRVRTRIVRLE